MFRHSRDNARRFTKLHVDQAVRILVAPILIASVVLTGLSTTPGLSRVAPAIASASSTHGSEHAAGSASSRLWDVPFADAAGGSRLKNGAYFVRLARRAGKLIIGRRGSNAGLAVTEIAGSRVTNVLAHVSKADFSPGGTSLFLSGKNSWCRFVMTVAFVNKVLHWWLRVNASQDPPLSPVAPDVQTIRIPSLRPYNEPLVTYAQATPVAGSSVFLGDRGMGSSLLYFSNFTSLGPYFNSTQSDPTQGSFTYPNASNQSPVGVSGSQFGYEPPGSGLMSLPLHHWLTVVDSYLVLASIPAGQSEAANQYLDDTDQVVKLIGAPSEPRPRWRSIAAQEIHDISNGLNWDQVGTHDYLKSYVSDQRVSPELITQLSVLLGLREFMAHARGAHPAAARMMGRLDGDLPTFFNPTCHTVNNSMVTGPASQEESWYFLTNLISLLQLARIGDGTARRELLASAQTVINLGHKVHYVFPMDVQCPGLLTSGAAQTDVAGGYAYLMLGLYGMTHRQLYLNEAQASLPHLLGHGFFLSYEVHMTAYGAATAEELYQRFHASIYRRIAAATLANFFNSVRLWDCTYGNCAGGRFHTYMGVNPLPWANYIAMREQYESWLALSAFLTAAGTHPGRMMAPEADLVRRFVTATPETMQYALPTKLPTKAETAHPSEYSFVTRNQLGWDIPLEDLRDGDSINGVIGQEIYGAGGPLIFAAFTPVERRG